jgi:hypothetical protein
VRRSGAEDPAARAGGRHQRPLTYLLVAITQSIDRLRKLLFLVDVSGELPSAPTVDLEALADEATPPAAPPTSLRRAAALDLAQELAEAHNTKYQVRGLVRDNIDLLARNVTENASRTGEHYIAEHRSDLRGMFNPRPAPASSSAPWRSSRSCCPTCTGRR